MKRKRPMLRYYGKNIAQHAQRRFFQRKKLDADKGKRQDRPAADDTQKNGKTENYGRNGGTDLCGAGK